MTSRLVFLILLVAGVARAAETNVPPASIGVSPSRIMLDVNGAPVGEALTVINMSDQSVIIDVEVANWDLDERNEIRQIPTEPGSLPVAMIINPTRFTIPQNSSQTVRFMVMPERLPATGEARAMIYFAETVPTDQPGVNVRFRLGVPVYANIGDGHASAQLHDVSIRKSAGTPALAFDLTATGSVHTRPSGYYMIWREADYPGERAALRRVRKLAKDHGSGLPKAAVGGPLQTKPVLPGTRRTVESPIALPLEDGRYLLALHLQTEQEAFQRVLPLNI